MDEVSYDMRIEINYQNPYDHVPEAERNNIVIKDRFRIAYYQLPYKNTPRILIRHFPMNVTQYLNMFPVKVGASAHYIPHTILSQSN